MPRESRLWRFRIQDILGAIRRINEYVEGMTFAQFAGDRKTLDAVERNFIAIGEAARSVPDSIASRYPDIPWADMKAMRNFVVHVYWGIDAHRIWDTIHTNLPAVVPSLERMLENEQDEDIAPPSCSETT